MAFFSRKAKVNVADFSRDFYDRYVFGPHPTGVDLTSIYAEAVRSRIAEADCSFTSVGLPRLTEECLSLRRQKLSQHMPRSPRSL